MRPKLDETSETRRFQLVITQAILDRVEAWRATQVPVPNMSEAIRRLIENGLDCEATARDRDGQRR